MARPKRSTVASSLRSTKITAKSTFSAKNGSTASISFKSSKITKWSGRKETIKGDAGVLKVETEEVKVVEEKVEDIPASKAVASTPRKSKKRTIDDPDEPASTKKLRVCNVTETGSDDDKDILSPVVEVSSDQTVPSSPGLQSSIPSDASTALTEEEQDERRELALNPPKNIIRLVTIYKSIISVLLLHYAIHSKSQPAILSEHLTNISRDAKTNVSLVDLQRITALSQNSLRLVHVDRRGNAIELVNGVSPKVSNLGAEFKTFIDKWWEEKVVAGGNEIEILNAIDLAPIIPHGNAAKTAKPTVLSKGQRRLQELKSFALTKQAASAAENAKKENAPVASSGTSLASRNASLMERIKARALAAKAAPPPPSAEVVQRRMALQSLESIIPILLQLTTPSSSFGSKQAKLIVPSTTSFPLHTIISNIKTSLQKPMSNQEVERCLRVLADEVASDFVKIVEWKGDSTGKGLVGVVFDKRGRENVEKWKYVEDQVL